MGWKLDKNGMHLKEFFKQMEPPAERLMKSALIPTKWPDLPHAWTNIFVEASRLHSYHAGHIFMVTHTLAVVYVLVDIF